MSAFNLLEQVPEVHKSGNSTPKTINQGASTSRGIENSEKLDEKLILASINSSSYKNNDVYRDSVSPENELDGFEDPLLISNPIALRRPRNDLFSIDGSDCDLNWICLLVFILACCIIIPLIYVLWIYEHPDYHPAHSRYDDVKVVPVHEHQFNRSIR